MSRFLSNSVFSVVPILAGTTVGAAPGARGLRRSSPARVQRYLSIFVIACVVLYVLISMQQIRVSLEHCQIACP